MLFCAKKTQRARRSLSLVMGLLCCLCLTAQADDNSYSLPPDPFSGGSAVAEPAPASDSQEGAEVLGNYAVVASAYTPGTNQLLYREMFTGLSADRRVQVHYFNPSGARFASKTLHYSGELYQPLLNITDIRRDAELSVSFDGPRMVMKSRRGSVRQEKVIYDNARVVVDAGFEAFIQLNWDDLIANKRVRFDIAYPQDMATVTMEARQIKASRSPLYNSSYGRQWVYFRIDPVRNSVATLLASPIYLAYDPNGRFLMRYQGRSNLESYEGKPWDVRIEYEYKG